MAHELNDIEPSLYEVFSIRPPERSPLKHRRSLVVTPICAPIQVPMGLPVEEVTQETSPLPTEGLWTVPNVMVYTQFSRSWVYKQVELGVLPCIRKGRGIRFDPQVIRDFFSAKHKRSRR